MKYDPELAAMLAQPWSNNACRGDVIYAMENCGFSPMDIRRVVAELHEAFDFCGLEEASSTLRTAPTDLGTSCPKVEHGKRAAPPKVPLSCVSPRDKGDCRSLFRIAL